MPVVADQVVYDHDGALKSAAATAADAAPAPAKDVSTSPVPEAALSAETAPMDVTEAVSALEAETESDVDSSSSDTEATSPTSPMSADSDASAQSGGAAAAGAAGVSPSAVKALKRHVIIFDWDDTLLGSSYLFAKGHRLKAELDVDMDEETKAELAELEACVVNTIGTALQYASVRIVTNGEEGWVQLSAAKWLPRAVPLLRKVKIISARSTYEAQFPGDPLQWKFHAMRTCVRSLEEIHNERVLFHQSKQDVPPPLHVLSLGDSQVERDAVRLLTKSMSHVHTKTVKFATNPTLEQLRRQLEMVQSYFQYILLTEADMDLVMSIANRD